MKLYKLQSKLVAAIDDILSMFRHKTEYNNVTTFHTTYLQ